MNAFSSVNGEDAPPAQKMPGIPDPTIPSGASLTGRVSRETPPAIASPERQELIVDAKREEQRDLLRYCSDEILTKISSHRDDSRLPEIVRWINGGQLAELLKKYREIDGAHYLLLAAYCYSSNPSLAFSSFITAFLFLEAAMEDAGYRLHDANEARVSENIPHLDPSMPDNVCISISSEVISEQGQDLLNTIIDQQTPGVFWFYDRKAGYYRYGLTSFPMAKRAIKDEENHQKLTPILGLSDRADMIRELPEKSHFALILPGEKHKIFVHGTRNGGVVWHSGHDYYHTSERIRAKLTEDPCILTTIAILEEALKKRAPLTVGLVYDGYIHSHLAQGASIEDWTTKIIDEVSGLYIDGEGKNLSQMDPFAREEEETYLATLKLDIELILRRLDPSDISPFRDNPLLIKRADDVPHATLFNATKKAVECVRRELDLQHQSRDAARMQASTEAPST